MIKRQSLKKTAIVTAVILSVATAILWGVNWIMKQPLYQLGAVSAGENLRAPLEPPRLQKAGAWQVEPDIRLHIDTYGEGPPILVIHGGPGIPYPGLWQGLEGLTERFQFHFYHQRGCGESTRPFDRFDGGNFYQNMVDLERTLGIGAQIADIERVRRILGQDKLTLIGHSFGGFLATLYAAEFPDRVEKLILVAPAGVLTPPDEERNLFKQAGIRLTGKQRQEFDEVVARYFDFGSIFSKSESELVEVHQQLGQYLLPAMGYAPQDLRPSPRSGGWTVFAMYFSAGRAQDYRPALDQVTAQTLILHGTDDEISLPGARTYGAIQNSRFVVFGRESKEHIAGHFLYDDCPHQFHRVLDGFLTEPEQTEL